MEYWNSNRFCFNQRCNVIACPKTPPFNLDHFKRESDNSKEIILNAPPLLPFSSLFLWQCFFFVKKIYFMNKNKGNQVHQLTVSSEPKMMLKEIVLGVVTLAYMSIFRDTPLDPEGYVRDRKVSWKNRQNCVVYVT